MNETREVWRSSWYSEDRKEKRRRASSGQFVRKLTPEQDQWLLEAWKLRQSLKDDALAKHLGLTRGQLQHHLIRVRKQARG